ncbi:SCO7613 C-terminal domain-containing membrane protein [Nocardioides pocheonensis]|nr:hypothetical protein [Nocardioides pocheonensis]
MSKLVDPHICPDCRASLDPTGTCTRCGLRLVGPAAAELWQRMQQADRLIEQLRAAPATAAPTAGPVVGAVVGAPPVGPMPRAATGDRTAPHRSLPSVSVPVVLLSLGALCLLVAAVVFVAVAWSSLGLTAKTTILLAVTALFGAGAVAVTRRDLRFAAETLWLVVSGLVAIDLGSAYGADLLGLGRLSDRDAVALVGATLLGLAVGAGAWATTTVLRRVHGLVVVAAIGIALLAGAEAWTSDHNPTAVALSVPLLAALALAIDRLTDGHLRSTAGVVGASVLVSWLVLVGNGADRMPTTSVRAWWLDLDGWPLLAAALLAALPAALPLAVPRTRSVLPEWVRMVAAGGSLVTLAMFGVGPGSGATADLLTWAAVSVLLAAVCATAPRVWAWPAAALTVLALVGWSAWALGRPLAVITRLPGTATDEGAHLGITLPAPTGGPAPWTAVVVALVVGAAAAALLRHLRPAAAREAAGRAWIALGPGVLALGATTWLLESRPTLLTAVLVWGATLAVTAAMATTVRHHDAPLAASLVFTAYLVATGLRLAVPSHLLSASSATVLALGFGVAYSRSGAALLRTALLPLLAGSAVLMAGLAGIHWPYLLHGRSDAAGLALAGVAAAALLLARAAGRGEASRVTIEVTALLAGLGATALTSEPTTAAMVLTVLGSAVAAVAILNVDREEASWIGVALLGVATVIRVIEDVRAPELYTLPAAAALIAAGWWRLQRDPGAASMRVLGSGLTLALVPSLLLALDEPVSLRGALVAAGGLVALAVGIARLWAGPFLAGALTTAALAVRHLGPVVDGLPRWISLGSVGLLLLLVGVTWEQRRRDVTVAGRYLAALR